MLSKKAALLFLGMVILICPSFFAALYIYDPISIFHTPYSRELTLTSNMRQQNIALIRHLPFDSVIVGNSYTENTSVREAGEQLGGKFINISMSGSNLYERSIVLEYVLRHHKIKTVFGVLTESTNRERALSYPLSEWSFLYDDNITNDFKVYLNRHYLRCLRKWSNSPECIGRQVDLDRPSAWFEDIAHASRFGGLDNWIMHHESEQLADLLHKTVPQNVNKPIFQREKDIAPRVAMLIRATIDEFIIQPAKEYPTTNFVYFFNPNPMLGRALAVRGNGLNVHAFWVRETTIRCATLNNVQLYFFDNEPFTEDIQYYKDINHYSPDINSLILQSVRLGKNRLTPDNVEAQLHLLAERAAAYDIKAFNAYIQEGIRRMDTE
jgi:hypothetical protein